MAEKACHNLGSTMQVGLVQALGPHRDSRHMLTLRLIDPGVGLSGVALGTLALCALAAARRTHWTLYVSSVFLAIAALPNLVRGGSDVLAWFGTVQVGLPSIIERLGQVQGYALLLGTLPVVWSTVVLLRQDRPNISLKRTNQSLRN